MNNRQDRALIPVQRQISKPQMDNADIVIIGNGIAGLTAAIEARHLAPDKRIVIITDQIHPTINTPALKQFAIAKLAREQLLAYPAGTERTERIHVVTAHVEEIHAKSKYLGISGGYGFGYDALLIATGSAPQGLAATVPGRNFDGVLTLHRLQDYLDLRRRIGEIKEAVVVGGGVHAIETVMGLQYWGIHVHWLIRGATFMRHMLDETASEIVLNNIRRSGVTVHTETEVAGIVARVGVVAGVITNQQEMIPCQLVLTCTGTQAVKTLAERSTIPIKYNKGIIVDDKLRSSVRDIFAAGDVAALRNPQTGEYEPRAQWYAAVHQGRIAGAMLAGHNELAIQPFGVPWHATHLGPLCMLTVGEPLSQDPRIMTLTDTSGGSYRRITILDDRLVGYLSLGPSQPDSLALKRIIDEGHSVRDITKTLLKGRLDTRQYLSQTRSRAAEQMLNSQKLLVARPSEGMSRSRAGAMSAINPPSTVGLFPVSGPLSPLPAANYVEAGPVSDQSWLNGYAEEEVSPFTGNLPSQQVTNGPQTASFTSPLAQSLAYRQTEEFEEINPFTGNLPDIPEQFFDAVPLSAEQQPAARSLLSYASAGNGRSSHRPEEQPNEGHARKSLWAYSTPQTATRGKERR